MAVAGTGKIPPSLKEAKTYESFKKELKMWSAVTEVPKKKQASLVALSLPNECKFGENIKERVLQRISVSDLNADDGLQKLTEFLDGELACDATTDLVNKWDDWFDYSRKSEQTMEQFIGEYELLISRLESAGQSLSGEIKGFALMRKAGLSGLERTLILSRLDFTDKSNLYKDIKIQCTNLLGKNMQNDSLLKKETTVKLEPIHLAEHEEALAAMGYYKRQEKKPWKKNNFRPAKTSVYNQSNNSPQAGRKKSNPKGRDGKVLSCHSCGSWKHLIRECPDKQESINITSEEKSDEVFENLEKLVLFTNSNTEMNRFTSEALNCAALDTCCSSSVAGKKWLEVYLESLEPEMKTLVVGPMKGMKSFQFGNQGVLNSNGLYKIPIRPAGKITMIEVDVIDSDIPLLLSKKEMQKHNVTIFMMEDKVSFQGKDILLRTTNAGHYILPLNNTSEVEDVFAVNLQTASDSEKKKALDKLHKQFGHRPKQAFTDLLKTAGSWSSDMSKILDKIIDNCRGCIMRKRNPDRPAVALPMASDFNEKLAIDLKHWKSGYILYCIDMWSRLTTAAFISRKEPRQVIDKIMSKWVAYYGVPGCILNDNGGEFTAEEIVAMKGTLNIVNLTTGANSPWQNGICEKNHALVDNMLERIEDDYPDLDVETMLAWACMAKNCLTNVYGYSPNQLVFGRSPKLPNVLTDGPVSWEESNVGETLSKHLTALHATRKAFISSESCAKLKLALKSKIRTSNEIYSHGDIVYFKKENDSKWQGPAKVVFADGKVIFLRNGGQLIRVSANRLVKAGKELAKMDEQMLEDEEEPSKEPVHKTETEVSQDLVLEEVDETVEKESSEMLEHEISKGPSENQNEMTTKVLLRKDDKVKFKQGSNSEWKEAVVLSRAGKATGKFSNWYNVSIPETLENTCIDFGTTEHEVIQDFCEEINVVNVPKDKRNSPECLQAKNKELDKLKEFNVYEVVDDLGEEIISTTWVLSMKEGEIRARLVARGFEEQEEIDKASPTMHKSSLRSLLTIAAMRTWQIETTDIKSAFLQGSNMSRKVYVKPPKEAGQPKGKIWLLKKCLYGLKDASRHWYLKVKEALLKHECKQSLLDPGVFYFKTNDKLEGIIGLHVDDFLHCGSQLFQDRVIGNVMKLFKVGKNEKIEFTYTGFGIKQSPLGVMLDQSSYVQNLDIDEMCSKRALMKSDDLTPVEQSQLRRICGALNWIVMATRPDLSFDLIELSTKQQNGKVSDLVRARKVLKKIDPAECKVYFPKLDEESIEIVAYTDASFGNLDNGAGSMGGHIVFLKDKDGQTAATDWKSKKIKRVVRSTLAAEALALGDGLDTALFEKEVFMEILDSRPHLKVSAVVDNKSVEVNLRSTSSVEDKRLRRDLSMIKEMLDRGEVHGVSWVEGSQQLADTLTKKGVNAHKLLSVLHSGKCLSSM